MTSPNNKKRSKLHAYLVRFGIFFIKTVSGAVILSLLYLVISWMWFFPSPEIVIKEDHSSQQITTYRIQISNPSNMEIHNFQFSVRFDEEYPIKDYRIMEPSFSTGIALKTYHNYYYTKTTLEGILPYEHPFNLVSGITGATSAFPPGATLGIHVVIDKTYDGSRGDVLPPTIAPTLRSNSYFFAYNHRPFGLLAPIAIHKTKTCYFSGEETEADNFGKYEQSGILPNGKKIVKSFNFNSVP